MRWCSVCKRAFLKGEGNLFNVPRDEADRRKWSEICGRTLKKTSIICADHFLPTSILRIGTRVYLLPNAEPIAGPDTVGNDASKTSFAEENVNGAVNKNAENIVLQKQKQEVAQDILNIHSNIMPPQLQEEPIIQMPVITTIACSGSTQTNTRLCGLLEASDLADEFRFNCFYCSEVFPVQKWKRFLNHLKNKHFKLEVAFKITKYVSKDHDYTPISLPPSTLTKIWPDKIVNIKSPPTCLVDPLEPVNNSFESVVFSPTIYYSSDENKMKAKKIDIPTEISPFRVPFFGVANISSSLKQKLKNSSILHMFQNKMNFNEAECRLKGNTNNTTLNGFIEKTEEEVNLEEKRQHKSVSSDIIHRNPTEISFEYSSDDMLDLLLNSMKNYPVLWHFDEEPFNEDFYEAAQDICKIINDKFSLNIDNLKMRRSINRILRFYCYLFPNDNVENVHKFSSYYDKCAVFLPHVNEIAYARCSHCYICYKNDFELKLHLMKEQKYLEWPYKCERCKECFRENDEYEFHNRLPHYDDIFRCEPCKRSFFNRRSYSSHIVLDHRREPIKYKCNIDGKPLQTSDSLKSDKINHGERKYKCHLCPKAYFFNSRLMLHLKSHRDEYDFICEVCGKGFVLQSNFRRHLKKHTGEKVTCNICNLKLRKSSLSRHRRIVHVPYGGNIESTLKAKNIYYKRLIRSKPLRPIQRKCGNRNYYCKTCNMSFEKYKLIVKHNKELHFDIPKWPCKMCNTEFSHKINLKRHYRKKHNFNVIQAFKLVDEKEDLNEVLAIETDYLEKLTETSFLSKSKSANARKSNTKSPTKLDFLPDEILFEEEKIHSPTMQDEILKAADNIETQGLKIDYVNDFFTDLFKEH